MNGDYSRWLGTNVRQQKQFGYFCRDRHDSARRLHERADAHPRRSGDARTPTARSASPRIRTSCSAGCRPTPCRELYRRLAAAGLGLADAGTIADVTSCPGAESCKLAVTQSRGLGKLLDDHLRERPELIARRPTLHIKISGCPNGCGQHHIAASASRAACGGSAARPCRSTSSWSAADPKAMASRFGRLAAKMPARRMTDRARAAARSVCQRPARRRVGDRLSSGASTSARVKSGALRPRADDAGHHGARTTSSTSPKPRSSNRKFKKGNAARYRIADQGLGISSGLDAATFRRPNPESRIPNPSPVQPFQKQIHQI